MKGQMWVGVGLLVGVLGLAGCGGVKLPGTPGSAIQQRMMGGQPVNANPFGVGPDGRSPYDQAVIDAKSRSETAAQFQPNGQFYTDAGGARVRRPTLSVSPPRMPSAGSVSHYFAEDGSPEDRTADGRLLTEENPPDIASPLQDAGFTFREDGELFRVVAWVQKQWREGREVWYSHNGKLWTGYRNRDTLEYMWKSGWEMMQRPGKF